MKPTLEAPLEAELEQIRKNPLESVGFGEKAYIPYQPNFADGLIRAADPAVTARLLAEAKGGGDRAYRLAALHVLGKRNDAAVDDALITALDDPTVRATSAYLLGRPGFRGYPARPRDIEAVRAALRKHLDDDTTFDDPFYRKSFRTQDFILAAYVRLTGPEKFRIADPILVELIGYALPVFSDDVREDLLRQAAKAQ